MRIRVLLCAAVLGCATSSPPPPPLPAGIAELSLPRDSRSLARIAAEEDPTGAVTRRREILADVARQLLMAPPSDALVPEMFDFLAAVAPRMEKGVISAGWGTYLYTSYQRDLVRDRPSGAPRRSHAEIEKSVDESVEFFHLRAGRKTRTIEDVGLEEMQGWRDERRLGR